MNTHDEDRMKQFIKRALPRIENIEPERDLWPAMVRRLDTRPIRPPWFDWALACGLVTFAAFFPASIPVFLYYL